MTARFTLPEGHEWKEVQVDSGCGIDYQWDCEKCGASFYVNIDQDTTNTEFTEGDSDACD